jgi:glutamyl-tRNA reductase
MNIVLLGLNHHSASVQIRECVAIPSENKYGVASALLDQGVAREVVVLSTCNRTEIVLCCDDPIVAAKSAREIFIERCIPSQIDALESSLFELRDSPAVRHLFEVVTSLDSLVIGEPHIIGQIRDDFEIARKAGTVGKVLGRLFLKSIELGKAVRRETAIGESPISVSSIALDLAGRVFGTIEGRTVLVLGAGEMGRQTAVLASHRNAKRIIVSSPTLDNARQLADRVKGQVYPWEKRDEAMGEVDIIVTSTAAPEPIINKEHMIGVMQGRRNQPVFIIDIAVPRDVHPDVDSIYNVYRYDLDDLTDIAKENENRRKGAIPEVRALIEEARHDFEQWRKELKVVPAIVSMREHIEIIRQSEVDIHLKKMHSIDERDANLVEALSHAIINKILHSPTVRLKEAAASGTDLRHASSLRYLFNLKYVKDGRQPGAPEINHDGEPDSEDGE